MKNSDRQNRASKPFVKNGPVIFDISGGGKILRGWVALIGNVNITAVVAGGVKIGAGGPVRLIDTIEIDANPLDPRYAGGKILDKVHPESLLEFATTRRRFYVADQLGANLGGNAAVVANYLVATYIPVYFADPRRVRPIETALNGDAYESIQLRVNCAAVENCFNGANVTVDYSGLTVQWIDDRENVTGDTLTLFQENHDFIIPAANKRALDLAMPKDGKFLDWLLFGLNTTNETLADTILNQLVINGDSLDFSKYAEDMRQQMFDDEWWSPDNGNPANPAASATGRYFVDFTDKKLGGVIDARYVGFYFDVSNPGGANQDTLRFFTRRILPPAGYVAIGAGGTGNSAAKNQ